MIVLLKRSIYRYSFIWFVYFELRIFFCFSSLSSFVRFFDSCCIDDFISFASIFRIFDQLNFQILINRFINSSTVISQRFIWITSLSLMLFDDTITSWNRSKDSIFCNVFFVKNVSVNIKFVNFIKKLYNKRRRTYSAF
jgi:hypothetical protein